MLVLQKCVAGCYILSSSAVCFEDVPAKLPRYPIPVVHLGRLAVDKSFQGRRLGELLLMDALRRAQQVSDAIGVFAVEVVAIHEQARRFYEKYGFVSLKDDPNHLYMEMKLIRKLDLG